MSIKSDVVKDYLSRFPHSKKKPLSKLIYNENKELFRDAEAVRNMINYYTGAMGDPHREKLEDKKFVRPLTDSTPYVRLPEGIKTLKDWDIVKITGDHKILILSDAHIPYHDKSALEMAVEKGEGSDIIILNGDWLDFFSVSRWQKDPRLRDFPKEIEIARLSFEWLRSLFPDKRIIFKVGNHEERYERYMQTKAPELLGVDNFELPSILHLDKYGFEYVTDKKPIKLNELFVIHGHEYVFSISNPVNPARGLYLRSKVNSICGHFHQSSSHSENNIEDKFTSTWSTGCLSDMHPDYMPLNKWNQGFAMVETSGTKFFQVHNYKIIDKQLYFA